MALKNLPTGDHAIADKGGIPPQAYLEWLQSVDDTLRTLTTTFDGRYEQIGRIANFGGGAKVANYVLVLTDIGQTIEMNLAGANTLTVPPNSSVAWPLGSWLNIVQVGAGQTTITPGAGVTLRARVGLKTAGQWAMSTIYRRAVDEWVVGGDVVP